MNAAELTGQSRGHLAQVEPDGPWLHQRACGAFRAMRVAAGRAGIDIAIASAFRDFERQRDIWNAKYRGERPVLDADGQPLDVSALDAAGKVRAILAWSALPGGSRHHWGTDLDLYDRAAVDADYRPGLVAAEYAADGPFGRLDEWLSGHMRRYGFYRPYATAAGGVQREPWHLSFAPVAEVARRQLTVPILADALRGSGVLGEEAILAELPQINARYLQAVDRPPRMRSRWAQRPAVASAIGEG